MRGFGADYWREVDRARVFPEAFFVEMGERGYFGTLLPERWGGSDAGPMAASVLIEAVNRAGGDASTLNAQMARKRSWLACRAPYYGTTSPSSRLPWRRWVSGSTSKGTSRTLPSAP